MNATLLAHLLGVLDNVSDAGLSVFDHVTQVLDNIASINTSLHDEILEAALDIIDNVNNETGQLINNTLVFLDNMTTLINSINTTLHDEIALMALEILTNISSLSNQIFNNTISFLNNMTDLINSINTSLHDDIVLKALEIMNNMSNMSSDIIAATTAILENISNMNLSINGSAIMEILNLTEALQQSLNANFSYIQTRLLNISDVLDNRLDLIYNALQEVNITGFDNLMAALQDILEQFSLPHEWQLPGVNYTTNDTMAPISAISATIAFGGGINVRWASTDDFPSSVAYTIIYYRIETNPWMIWKPLAAASGEENFNQYDEELVNGTTYWFKCIGVDTAGNIEAETDANVCNITYYIREIPSSAFASPDVMIQNAITDIYFWVIILLLVAVLGILALRKRRIQHKILQESKRIRRPVYIEEAI